MFERVEADTFIADARADLEEVSEALGVDLTNGDLAEDVDTLGGLIVTIAGRVPARSELIAGPDGLEFEVLDADPRRLKRVRIHRRDPSAKIGTRLVTVKPSGGKQPMNATAAESAAAPSEDTEMQQRGSSMGSASPRVTSESAASESTIPSGADEQAQDPTGPAGASADEQASKTTSK
jgi:hypothetical protein